MGRAHSPERIPLHVWVILAGLIASVFSGYGSEMGLPVSPDRPLLLVGLLLLALHRGRDRLRWSPVYAAMAFVVVATLFSWLGTGSLGDDYQLFGFIDRIVMPFAMFVAGCLTFTTPLRRLLVSRVGSVLGVYLVVMGLQQLVGTTALLFPRYLARYADAGERVVGPFGNSEAFGMACALTLALGILGALRDRGWWRAMAWLGIVASSVGVVVSMTRSVWLAALLGLIVWAVVEPRVRRLAPWAVALGVGALALVTSVLPDLLAALVDRLTTTRSLYDRDYVNEAALRVIAEHPWGGIGWLRFVEENVLWVRQADDYPITTVTIEVHNVFLSRAAETGIPAAIAWGLAMLLGPMRSALAIPATAESRAWKAVAWSALLVWIFPTMLSPNPYVFPNLLIWMIGGIAGRGILLAREVPRAREIASAGSTERVTGLSPARC